METREYRYIDKSLWDRGPWDNEPDKIQWQDQVTGRPCLAVRSQAMGSWCGYVGVAEGHPYFERGDCDELGLSCHGGISFNGHCTENDKEHGICHVPAPGEPDHVWWLGFDCAHAFDLMPAMVATLRKNDGAWLAELCHLQDKYRTLPYVKGQCRKLALQLAAVH